MLTKDKKSQGCDLPGGVIPQPHAAHVCAVVCHGHCVDGDTHVPRIYITTELYAVFVALAILDKSIKIPSDSIILREKEGKLAVLVSSVWVYYLTRWISPWIDILSLESKFLFV